MKRLFRCILIFVSVTMLFFALSGGYIAYYVSNNRETIKNLFVEQVGELTVGKWDVDSISINIWKSYPHVVVNLHNLKLYENASAQSAGDAILAVDNAWFRADIPSLMSKRLVVNDIGFSDVTINLRKEIDRDFNLIEALKLNNKIEIDGHLLSFKIEKIDITDLKLNLAAKHFSTQKPWIIDRFIAGVKRNGDILNLSDCSLECYRLKFLLDIEYDDVRQCASIDLSSESRLVKFKGDLSFSKTSIVTIKSNVESSIPLSEYFNDKLRGEVFAKGVVDFDFDMINYRMLDDRCRLRFGVNNVLYNHPFDYMPQVVLQSGSVEYSRSSIVGDRLIVGIGTNKLEMNFITGSIIDLINKRNHYNINFSADIKSSDFNPYIIKERLGVAADSLSDKNSIQDLFVRLHTTITPDNWPASVLTEKGRFYLAIDDYRAKISDNLTVSDFNGDVEIGSDSLLLHKFKGMIADSPINFDSQIAIKKRDNSEFFDRINIDVDFAMAHLSTHQIIAMQQAVILNDVRSKFSAEIKPNLDKDVKTLESFKIDFKTFSAIINGKPFSQQSVVVKNKEKVEVLDAIIKYDKDIFDMSGTFYIGAKNRRDTLNIKTKKINFESFLKDKSTGVTELPAIEVPLVVNLNVGKFEMLDQQLIDLKGAVCIEKNRSLHFKNIRCYVAGGEIEFNGKLIQSPKFMEIKCDANYNNIDFSNLNIKYQISKNDNIRYINENLRGIISGNLNADIFVDKDINIDTKLSAIDAKFTIINGQLIDFAPIKAASKYFQRSNLNDIRFDTLSNHVTIKSGVISVPRMNIASTLGNYFATGTTNIEDGYMDFIFEVPWNVIGGVVASRLFGGKPHKDEEIDDKIKKRYVKFQIVGTPEKYEVKLKRRGDEKSNK